MKNFLIILSVAMTNFVWSQNNPTSYNPNNPNAEVNLSWKDDIARIRYGGSGIGAGNGFQIQGSSSNVKLSILDNAFVGIATAQPNDRLEIEGNSNDTYMRIHTNGNYKSGIKMLGGTMGIWNLYHDDAASNFNIGLDNSSFLTVKSNGDVGIGTSPGAKFEVYDNTILGGEKGNTHLLSIVSGNANGNIIKSNLWLLRDSDGSNWYTARIHDGISIDVSLNNPGSDTRTWWERDPRENIQSWGNAGNTYMTLKGGKLGIGTDDPQNQLSVEGTIWATEIKVSMTDAADWVFENDYKLRPLKEVEEYIIKNKHLPEVPSAEEFRTNDLNVAEMDNILLQKIEELTLYQIELLKRIEELEKEK